MCGMLLFYFHHCFSTDEMLCCSLFSAKPMPSSKHQKYSYTRGKRTSANSRRTQHIYIHTCTRTISPRSHTHAIVHNNNKNAWARVCVCSAAKMGEKTRVGCWLAWPCTKAGGVCRGPQGARGRGCSSSSATSCCVCPSNQREEGEPMMSRVPKMGMKVGKQFYSS